MQTWKLFIINTKLTLNKIKELFGSCNIRTLVIFSFKLDEAAELVIRHLAYS